MSENPRFHTVHGEHPEHSEFEAVFRVHSDETVFVHEPEESTFPTTNAARRMACLERAGDRIRERFGEQVTVSVDEDDL